MSRLESEKGFCPHNYKLRGVGAKLENREKLYEITPCLAFLACLAFPASGSHALCPFPYAAVA